MDHQGPGSEEIVEVMDKVFGPETPFPESDALAAAADVIPCSMAEAVSDYRLLAGQTRQNVDAEFSERAFARWLERWAHCKVDDVKPTDINMYFAELSLKQFNTDEIGRELQLMTFFFTWANRAGFTASNPMVALAPLPTRPTKPAVVWTFLEQRRLLEACKTYYTRNRDGFAGSTLAHAPPYLYPLVLLALQSGLRLATLLRLEWRHVELKIRALRLPPSEGNSRQTLEIRLPGESAELLQTLWNGTKVLPHRPDRIFDAWGVPYRGGTPDETMVLREFRRARSKARIRPGDFESLRHTFAYNCFHAGVPFTRAATLVDWDDMGFLVTLYQNESRRKARVSLRRFSDEIGGETTLPRSPSKVRARRRLTL